MCKKGMHQIGLITFLLIVGIFSVAIDVKAQNAQNIHDIEIFTLPRSNIYLSGSFQGQSDDSGYLMVRVNREINPELQYLQLRITNEGFRPVEKTINLDALNSGNIDMTLSSLRGSIFLLSNWYVLSLTGALLVVFIFIGVRRAKLFPNRDNDPNKGDVETTDRSKDPLTKIEIEEETEAETNISEVESPLINSDQEASETAENVTRKFENLSDSISITNYQIIRKIAKGGVATIYEALNSENQTVALKIMSDFLQDEDMVNKFIGEGWALQEIKKKFPEAPVITVYEYGRINGEQDGIPYISMELVEGQSLGFFIKNNVLNYDQKTKILTQLAHAIDAAHMCKILHRDISPDNILLKDAADLEIRLIDFGVARHEVHWLKGTSVGAAFGKPEYMAPEQIEGGELDYRCDYYSMGIVIYALFTGNPPFRDSVMYKVFEQHINSPIPEMPDSVPENIKELSKWMLAKKPTDRPENINQILDLLK